MLGALKNKVLKGYIVKPIGYRAFASTATIKDRFETAWMASQQSHVVHDKEPENKAEYSAGYYQRYHKRMKKGYTHPYHSNEHPLTFTSVKHLYDTISNLVGPEQVSPHYESLSRSRRGLLFTFAYVAAITNIARLGGWDNNEWIRGLVFHAEYLMAFYIGYIEIRHFTFLPGPKFTIFYDVFTKYEVSQLLSQWADTVEELQQTHYQHSREQVEYMRIHEEYQFIKKRALVTFLINERLNLEKHFHDRTVNMLNTITSYEQQNMKNKISSIAQESFASAVSRIEKDHDGSIKRNAFKAALEGMKKGRMGHENDPVLPLIQEEILSRTSGIDNSSLESLLSLKPDQRKSIAQMDKAAKDAYLKQVPHITAQGLKSHDKFQKFVTYLTNLNKKD